MYKITLVLFLSFLIFYGNANMPYPWHASCMVRWKVSLSCQLFKTKIINQLELWKDESLCPTDPLTCPSPPCGQNCLYKFISSTANTVLATHTTPVARYVDDITFTMSNNGSGCSINATSSSQTWYAVLDYGTNYCNLRNLVAGAGISDSEGFLEETSDPVCTQYSSRDCTRY